MSYYDLDELATLKFKAVGKNVYISKKASLYGIENISIGDNVRIDDFCILSAGIGGIIIGSYVHIAVYTSLIGSGRIEIEDFSNLSSRISIYSSNDDYSGEYMTNPMVPNDLTNVLHATVRIRKHVIIGSGCVILPDVTIGVGCAVGALSLVKSDLEKWGVYAGQPVKRLRERSMNLLKKEKILF
jgi:galactoside O-acetyltransferase